MTNEILFRNAFIVLQVYEQTTFDPVYMCIATYVT